MDVLKEHCVEVQPLSLFTQVSGGHLVCPLYPSWVDELVPKMLFV